MSARLSETNLYLWAHFDAVDKSDTGDNDPIWFTLPCTRIGMSELLGMDIHVAFPAMCEAFSHE